jgi:hypothetical protein
MLRYKTEHGSEFDILKYLGAGEFLIEVISKKGGHYQTQINARSIVGFNFEEYKKNKNIKEEKQPKKTVTTKIKNKRKRRRK